MLILLLLSLFCKTSLCSVYNDTDMIKLGNTIKKSLKKPVGWHEPTLERDTHVYCDELEQLYAYIKMDNSEGERVYNAIKQHGGPPQLKCKIDKILLKNQYDWSDYAISELGDVLEETKDKWMRIGLALENKKKIDNIKQSKKVIKERKRLAAKLWQKKLQNETFLKQLREQKTIKQMLRKQQKQKSEKNKQKKQGKQNKQRKQNKQKLNKKNKKRFNNG